jgi:four helix bundle protein
MNFTSWLETMPIEITGDPLWNMEVYRQALFVGEIAWTDVCKLAQDRRMLEVSGELYRSVGSISANIAEGYSKASKKDEARCFESALGSARAARDWYYKARHVLGEDVFLHRARLLVHIIQPLFKLVPEFRSKKIAEDPADYEAYTLEALLENIPFST